VAGVDDQVGIISRWICAAYDVNVAKRDSKGFRVVVGRPDGTYGPREIKTIVVGYAAFCTAIIIGNGSVTT
jgi:hypothetical protein